MKYLKIQNDGVLDIRLVALMGGTTKANNQYKIGQFGTGLKYAMAYLFRENLDFKVFAGENVINIVTERETIKDTEFEIICIEGNRTSITTQMGKEFTAWMILRELHCNALDEGGEVREVVNETQLVGMDNTTTFYIQVNSEIQDVLDNWNKYFIDPKSAIWENKTHAIYHNKRDSNLRLYKNGVLIYEHPKQKSLFSYDIKQADINELREFKGHVSYEIMKALAEPNEDVINYFLNNITDDFYEGSEMDYGWFTSFANIWKNTVGDRRLISRGSDWSEGIDINFNNVIKLPKKVYGALTKEFEGLGVLARSNDEADFFETKNDVVAGIVEKCTDVLNNAGYFLGSTVEVKIGVFSNSHLLHSTLRNKNTILLSELLKDKEPKDIALILVEENEFLKSNCSAKEITYYKSMVKSFVTHLLAPANPPLVQSSFTAVQ